jgi:hypothetical protein
MQVVEERQREQHEIKMRLTQAREQAEEEIKERNRKAELMGVAKEPRSMFHKLNFKEEDHTRIKTLKPFMKQIVFDLKSHAEEISQL